MNLQGSQLLSLRGDSMKTQSAFCCYLISLSFLLLSFIGITSNIPHSMLLIPGAVNCHELTQSQIRNEKYFCSTLQFSNTKYWTSYFMNITEYNQFLMIRGMPMKRLEDRDKEIEKFDLKYSLKVEHVDSEGRLTTVAWPNRTHTTVVKCDTLNNDGEYLSHVCDSFTIFLEPELLVGNYRLELLVENVEDIDHLISGLVFEAYKINEKYTGFFISFRYFVFTVSLVLGVWFCTNYGSTPSRLRVFEQRYMVLLVVGLNFFNDPFIGINIVSPTNFSVFISIFCNVTFLSLLLFFWLVMFERVFKENEKKTCQVFSCWKILLISVFWLFSILGLCSVAFAYLEDPSFHLTEDYPSLAIFSSIILAIIYLTVLGFTAYGLIKSLQVWKTRIQRHKIFIGFSIFFILLFQILFISGAYDYYSLNGPHIVLSILTCNIYVYVLMYIYSIDDQSMRDLENERKRKQLELEHRQNYMYLEDIRKQDFEEEMENHRRDIEQSELNQQRARMYKEDEFDVMEGKDEIALSFDDDDDDDEEKEQEEEEGL